jgi:hypothetical protein
MASADSGLYLTFFMIEQATLALLPDRDGAGDLLYQIEDALPPEWSESYPDWDRTAEALQNLVEGRPTRPELLDRYPDAVFTLYHAWGEWPRTTPVVPVPESVLVAARQSFESHGIIECARILDWTRGSPLLTTTPVGFPRFSYLTAEEVASAKPVSPPRPPDDPAAASLCASVISIVNEARDTPGRGLYSIFEVRDAAEQGVEADEA